MCFTANVLILKFSNLSKGVSYWAINIKFYLTRKMHCFFTKKWIICFRSEYYKIPDRTRSIEMM
ncbi:hypothetical protein E27107_280160 [Elizabethkingia anophelis]|nr:hypothetical protein E18064_290160 [Elizabethkingia anophelis]CDN78125.1 hypothetical protein E27107_280160 [Elizabethkingia anophelis]